MTYTLQIRPNGNSNSVLLPKEMMNRLGLNPGDKIFATETPDGMLLTKHDVEFERQMKIAEEVMEENYDVLRLLSQS
jgi:putative addiction module antidote